MKLKNTAFILTLAVGLVGCSASQRYKMGNDKGYKDFVAYQQGGQVHQGFVVGYLDGWRNAYTQADIEARKAALAKQQAELAAKEAEEQAKIAAERQAIREKLGPQ